MNIRPPVVAGQFYPADPQDLIEMLKNLCDPIPEEKKIKAKAIIVPHAGYIYSGRVAGMVYSRVKIPKNIILLGPNHTGYGPEISTYPDGYWLTPLGKVPVNENLTAELTSTNIYIPDYTAHVYEHSLEVQLPFLQFLAQEDFKIVPTVFKFLNLDTCLLAGDFLANVLENKNDYLIVISTDFSHYVPYEVAKQKDALAIKQILNLDPENLYKVVIENDISMCGVVPATVALRALKHLGAKKAELVAYQTSGDVNQDYSSVVGYAGIIIS